MVLLYLYVKFRGRSVLSFLQKVLIKKFRTLKNTLLLPPNGCDRSLCFRKAGANLLQKMWEQKLFR